MKNILYITCLSLLFIGLSTLKSRAQVSAYPLTVPDLTNPWKANELIEPALLATEIRSGNTKDVVLNIGAVEDIPGATHIGAVSDQQHMEGLKTKLAILPKNTPIVLYCGCCPFTKCPNIRPAYQELKKQGFTNIKVLDLPNNLKTNWIAKGYPLAKGGSGL